MGRSSSRAEGNDRPLGRMSRLPEVLAVALTGGPGAGKTAVVDALQARGYCCVPESARAIIRQRLSLGLSRRPPAREFAEQILERDKDRYRSVSSASGPIFFDRCYVDALGMLHELGVLPEVKRAAVLAEFPLSVAFIFPPWEEIYATDAERDQTFAQAVAVHDGVAAWYRKCGCELIEVPRAPVEARCAFILRQVR